MEFKLIALDLVYTALESVENYLARFRFGGTTRIQFYEELAGLIKNGVQLNDALAEMELVASDRGRHPRNVVAVVASDCSLAMENGASFSKAMRRWLGDQEGSLLSAGERAGDLPAAFEEAIESIKTRSAIKGALASATVYPCLLAAMIVYMLNLVTYTFVPKFGRILKDGQWEGDALTLKQIAHFVSTYGAASLTALIVTLCTVLFTLPYLTGTARIYLDRAPPWSIYRILNGATFLLNTAMMLRAGIGMEEAIRAQAEGAKPWLKERLEQALYGIGLGNNLGVALNHAGFGFPDRKAIQHIEMLAGRSGADVALYNFAKSWMARTIKQLELAASVMFYGFLFAAGYLILVIVGGIFAMQDVLFRQIS